MASFSERISELIKESGRSMTVIANDLGVSKQTISAWCNGTRSPKQLALTSVANYFKTTTYWLRGYDVEKHPSDYAEKNRIVVGYIKASKRNDAAYRTVSLKYIDDVPTIFIDEIQRDFIEAYMMIDDESRQGILNSMMNRLNL